MIFWTFWRWQQFFSPTWQKGTTVLNVKIDLVWFVWKSRPPASETCGLPFLAHDSRKMNLDITDKYALSDLRGGGRWVEVPKIVASPGCNFNTAGRAARFFCQTYPTSCSKYQQFPPLSPPPSQPPYTRQNLHNCTGLRWRCWTNDLENFWAEIRKSKKQLIPVR